MTLNDKPCNQCQNYDSISKGAGARQGRHGWCTVKSLYPYQENEGQAFPNGVKRADPGVRSKPHIVVGTETQRNCAEFRAKAVKLTKPIQLGKPRR